MKKLFVFAIAALAIASVAACTDTQLAHYNAIGSDAKVTCYSGSTVTYDGESSGKVSTVQGSDGWDFMEKATGRLVRVSGACVIRN